MNWPATKLLPYLIEQCPPSHSTKPLTTQWTRLLVIHVPNNLVCMQIAAMGTSLRRHLGYSCAEAEHRGLRLPAPLAGGRMSECSPIPNGQKILEASVD